MDLVAEHQLAPFLGARVPAISELAVAMPSPVLRELRASSVRSGLDAVFRTTELFRLFRILEKDVQPIALKGAAVAHTLYAESAEREMSDLDLLFGSSDEAKIAELVLSRHGFLANGGLATDLRDPTARPRHHHRPPIINGVSELTIELHTNLSTPPLPKTAILEMFRMKRRVDFPGAGALTVLDPICAVLHHALHAIADPIDSPLLRNLFEVAWMVQGLSRVERSTVRTLARRWGVEDRVASALTLAHELFGSPLIVDQRSLGARELWSLRRLEWIRPPRPEQQTWSERVTRDLARRHLDAVSKGAGRRALRPLFAAAMQIVHRAIASRITAKLSRRPKAVEPVTLHLAPVGGSLVAHDEKTGYVHLLDGLSAEIFRAVDAENDAEKIETLMKSRGVEEKTTRLALDQLIGLGILRAPRRSARAEAKSTLAKI